ncbi:MAG: hypothetical protein AB7O45_04355 [Alphaproteobacteria bacterium]
MKRLAAALLLALATPAAATDLPGFHATRWGMTQAEIDRLYGARLRKPERPIRYHGARVEAALPLIMFDGQTYTAQFQLDDRDGRLQQVLVERRGGGTSEERFAALVAALEDRLGAPGLACRRVSDPPSHSVVWTAGTTTVHAIRFGRSNPVLSVNPSREIVREAWEPRDRYPNTRVRPRLVVRYHPTAREDLFGDRSECRPA